MVQDEIYLVDMWRVVRRQWACVALVAALVVAAALAWVSTAKSQWEATAWIQVGQVGTAPVGQDPKVEPFQRALARLQSEPFQDDVLRGIGLAEDSAESRLYRKSINFEPELYANLIRLRVRAYSAEDARQLAMATGERLAAIHEAISKAQRGVAEARLAEIDRELAAAEADRERLRHQSEAGSHEEALIASVALAGADGGIHTLRQSRAELDARMTPSYTFPTSMPWPVHVSDGPVAPMRIVICVVALFVGLFLGVVAATALDAARRRSTKRLRLGTHAADKRRVGEPYDPAANPGDVNAA